MSIDDSTSGDSLDVQQTHSISSGLVQCTMDSFDSQRIRSTHEGLVRLTAEPLSAGPDHSFYGGIGSSFEMCWCSGIKPFTMSNVNIATA